MANKKINVFQQLKITKKNLSFKETLKDWGGKARYQCECGNKTKLKFCSKCDKVGKKGKFTELSPTLEFELELKHLGLMESARAGDLINELAGEYVNGYGEKDQEGYIPPKHLMLGTDTVVLPSYNACVVAGLISIAQCGPAENHYLPVELLLMMASDDLFKQLIVISNKLSLETIEEDSDPNELAQPTTVNT